jgi:DNA-binding IclR family transcriptional regulator
VAVDLKLFDALAGSQGQGQGKTASQLSSELSLKQDRVDRFLRALVSLGLLELRDDGNLS